MRIDESRAVFNRVVARRCGQKEKTGGALSTRQIHIPHSAFKQ